MISGRLFLTAAALAVAALQTAAPEKLFGQRAVEGYSLLRQPKVQKALGMTRGQILRIVARDQAAEALIETASPPPKVEEIPALTKKQEEIREKAIAEVLDEKQRRRLLQILGQQQGASLLLKKEMEQALQLSDTQRFVLYSIHQETVKKVKDLPAEAPGVPVNSPVRQAKLRRIRLAGYNHMLRALTPEQRKKYRELLGPPLELSVLF